MGSIAKAMKDALEATGYSELRDYQRKTIEAYLSGKDVFVSAPTGAGKSLTFELAPYTFDHLFGEACNAIVFVIVPLISLMKDQVSNLNSRSIRASYVGDDCSEEQLEDILNLKEKIAFGSTEAILNNNEFTLENTCSGVKFFGKMFVVNFICGSLFLRIAGKIAKN